jgi:hypothetical protein
LIESRTSQNCQVLGGLHLFNAETPFRRRDAEWVARLWQDLEMPTSGAHTRRLHYRLVSQKVPVLFPNGSTYENTRRCSHYLDRAVRDAIALDLIPHESVIDNKNPAPIGALREYRSSAILEIIDYNYQIEVSDYLIEPEVEFAPTLPQLPSLPSFPSLSLSAGPTVPQKYQIEIWCEKSTMNDILIPLGRRYGVGIVTGTGDLSATACRNAVDRIAEDGRPARLLYVSDFDPGGMSMPVGMARKIEFELHKRGLLDVQVEPVVLTHDQCIELGLPRTPTKEGDSRAAGFEARFGEGATELDALEAIHPGMLARILTKEIERFRDTTLSRRVSDAVSDVEAELSRLNIELGQKYGPELVALRAEHREIDEKTKEIQRRFEEDIRLLTERAIEDLRPVFDQAQPIFDEAVDVCPRARSEIEEKAPDPDTLQWPEPAEGDEYDNPLFDSQRPYLEQIDRYKRHQGKLG